MYHTSLSKWNAYNMGPKRDIIGELSDAARKQGLIFGLSSHRIEHWFFFSEGKKFKSDVQDPKYQDFYGPAMDQQDTAISTIFMNDWLLRSCELVDKYQPQLFWFDWYIEQPCMKPYLKTFAAYYYNHGLQWNKGVVINFKNEAFPDNVAVYDIERGSSRAARQYPWQTDTSIGKKSWGYIRDEVNKSPDEIIDAMIDIVSKNGNLLLNVGPKPDGTLPQGQVDVLLRIGAWLDVNGEGIYGTRPWKISGEGPTVAMEGAFGESKSVQYTSEDIRFTSKGKDIYAFCLEIPAGKKIDIKSLGLGNDPSMKIKSIGLMGSPEKIYWKQKNDRLTIQVPGKIPCREALGFKITFM
jgi:alpha-L-fucosidase